MQLTRYHWQRPKMNAPEGLTLHGSNHGDFVILSNILKHAITQDPWLLNTCTSLSEWMANLEHYITSTLQAQHLVSSYLQDIILQGSPFDFAAAHALQHFQRLPVHNDLQHLSQLQIFIFAVAFCNYWLDRTIVINVCIILKCVLPVLIVA